MLGPVLLGLIAALVAALPALLREAAPMAMWMSPYLPLVAGALIALLFRTFPSRAETDGRRVYDGLADLFIHIHVPAAPDPAGRWGLHGAASFLLTLMGGSAGLEGPAVELTHALTIRVRARSARWFEQRRRTDAATALAAGVAAAFHAPFAAVLLPLELGIGGRAISVALAALSAFLGIKFLGAVTPLGTLSQETFEVTGALYGFRFSTPGEWLGVLAVAATAGVAAAMFTRFIRWCQEGVRELFGPRPWARALAGGVLLTLVALTYKSGHGLPWALLEEVIWARRGGGEAAALLIAQLLSLTVVLSAFGSVGIFWPLFAAGGYLGWVVNDLVLQSVPGFGPVASLAGGAAMWGAVLGVPVAGAVVAYELTGNIHVLLPCLVTSLVARQLCQWLRTQPLVDKHLEARGVSLIEGRSASVLEAVRVRSAMVTDHEVVPEHEPVTEIQARLRRSRYPFLPVVGAQGQLVGLLTVDMVQEASHSGDASSAHSPLSGLLEAKDLLYRSGFKTPVVRVDDSLSVTTGMFEEVPCVPVLEADGRVAGLLFVYNVRLAYDLEVGRRALESH